MSKIIAGITTSVDGYITGPDDGPAGARRGRRAAALLGLRRSVDLRRGAEGRGDRRGQGVARRGHGRASGAVIGGRRTYEAAAHWGDENPWALPFFIVTHRPEEQPDGGDSRSSASLDEAIEQAAEAAGDKDVNMMGGADIIRQALAAGSVDELTIIVAPIVLGGGKRLFDGSTSASSSSTSASGSRRSRPSSTTASGASAPRPSPRSIPAGGIPSPR